MLVVVAAAVALLAHFHVIRLPWQKTDAQRMLDNPTLYSPDPGDIETAEDSDIAYVNNIILIFFEPNTPDTEMQEAVDSVEGEVVGCLKAIDQLQVKVKTSSLDELKAMCSELTERDCVAYASYDEARMVSGNMIPNDPWGTDFGFGVSWDSGSLEDSNWWVNATDAMFAWDYAKDFDEITIGIVDSGFDPYQEDLSGRISLISEHNSVEDHGTHVAGVIGATHDNGLGISGIVPNCNLITSDWQLTKAQETELTAQGGQWSTTNQIIGQTVIHIQNGAKVVNLSAGCTGFLTGTGWNYFEHGRLTSIYLRGMLERGYDFVLVQSAGNGNADYISVDAANNGHFCSITYENCATSAMVSASDIIDRIIVVGAAGMDGRGGYVQAPWSNAGSRVDICAPGVNIFSTFADNAYGYCDGTSMAAPVVTGTAALVWAANPNLTGADVKRIVCENTKDVVRSGYSEQHPFYDEYPMVNTLLAVEAAMQTGVVNQPPAPGELYASVLQKYRDDMGQLKENASIEFPDGIRFYVGHANNADYYYAFHDIDENGSPELLIGTYLFQSSTIEIVDVFALDGQTPAPLFRPLNNDYAYFHAGEIPACIRLFSDGTICAQMGFDDELPAFLRAQIASDGCSPIIQQGLFAVDTPMNPASPDEPANAYFAYVCNNPSPEQDYGVFLDACIDVSAYQIRNAEPYGIQNDYQAWAYQMCSQYGSPFAPEWQAF